MSDIVFPSKLKTRIHFISESLIKSVIVYKIDCANTNTTQNKDSHKQARMALSKQELAARTFPESGKLNALLYWE